MKRNLPRLQRFHLSHFSLFSNQPDVVADFPAGVFCLAGANGLGKSSFLATIAYALTGAVPRPGLRLSGSSLEDYYALCSDYAVRYFDGRVDELDRDVAEVSIRFTVGSNRYELTRGLFEPQALRRLEVLDPNGRPLSSPDADAASRHEHYISLLVSDCALSNFAQFVFLQHFLLTFDERRHLLFWDTDATDAVLHLAFGIDANTAKLAADLQRRMNRFESLARNAQWQATNAQGRLNRVGGELNEDDLGNLLHEHQKLTQAVDTADAGLSDAQSREGDARLELAEASAHVQALREQYDQLFARGLEMGIVARHHPIVVQTLHEQRCQVCGSAGDGVVQAVEARIADALCPLCGSQQIEIHDDQALEELQRIDTELANAQMTLDAAHRKLERLARQVLVEADRYTEATKSMRHFEATNARIFPNLTSADALAQRRETLVLEIEAAKRRRDEYRVERDEARKALEPLRESIADAYREAELTFVPLFRTLAHQFLGLSLDIYLQRTTTIQLAFGIEVQGARRRSTDQLSESQRFFLDIALRMALAKHMAPVGSPPLIVVDTPEGSLDIAYEARAGSMFADFVADGSQLVMTANINASQLLRRLASRCSASRMTLVRMTDWAPLSEVQAEEEELFDEAYEQIEAYLRQTPTPLAQG